MTVGGFNQWWLKAFQDCHFAPEALEPGAGSEFPFCPLQAQSMGKLLIFLLRKEANHNAHLTGLKETTRVRQRC